MKNRVLRECLKIAFDNNTPDHPQWECYKHFSFIVQKNKVVRYGTNRAGAALIRYGYQPYQKIHSEADVYFKARGIMEGDSFEVVNIRLTKTFMIRDSTPCKCCWSFLKKLGCKKIYYTTNIGEFASINCS